MRDIAINDIYAYLNSRDPAKLSKSRVGLIKDSEDIISNIIAFDSAPTDVPEIDEREASCLFTISTIVPDRGNDEVLPTGCSKHLYHYQANPTVFFSHRSSEYPIAIAESPKGDFAFQILPDRLRSRAYFHLKTRESQEVFDLLACKALRGASIGMIPHKALLIEAKDTDNGSSLNEEVIDFAPIGLKFLEWELFEWSVVPVPMNREALAEKMSRGLIKSAILLRELAPYKHKQRLFGMDPASNGFMYPVEVKETKKMYTKGWEKLLEAPFNLTGEQIATLSADRVALLLSGRSAKTITKDVDPRLFQIKEVAAGRQDPSNPLLLDLPDIRQPDHFSCGACSAMAVGQYFGVGPKTLEEWKTALGTNVERSTHPKAICDYLTSLGLCVEAKDNMTLDDLKAAWLKGSPVICPVQDYGPAVPEKAQFAYGHYLTVVGYALEHVFCQDSSAENIEIKNSGTIAEKGRILIKEDDWIKSWHDKDADNKPFIKFGIIVNMSDTIKPNEDVVTPAPVATETKELTPAMASDLVAPAATTTTERKGDIDLDALHKSLTDLHASHSTLMALHTDLHEKMNTLNATCMAMHETLKTQDPVQKPKKDDESTHLVTDGKSVVHAEEVDDWSAFLAKMETISADQKKASEAFSNLTGKYNDAQR